MSNMVSAAKICEYLSQSIEAFQSHPADTPFLRGYEAAVTEWKRAIDNNLMDERKLMELQLVRFCPSNDPDFRTGFWSAVTDVNEDLAGQRN